MRILLLGLPLLVNSPSASGVFAVLLKICSEEVFGHGRGGVVRLDEVSISISDSMFPVYVSWMSV